MNHSLPQLIDKIIRNGYVVDQIDALSIVYFYDEHFEGEIVKIKGNKKRSGNSTLESLDPQIQLAYMFSRLITL